ncbi:MAG: hypothetical protein QG675_423 [Patescibacteria group bacterium]|jgi:hypothetical protein|nr:hypothetical protein [Patescibacteria group bacterium]
MTEQIPRYTRKALEKIWNVLQEIEENRQISSPEDKIKLPFMPPNFSGSRLAFDSAARQRSDIIKRLVYLNALKNLGNTTGIDGYLYFETGSNYNKVFKMYKGQYENAARDYVATKQPEKEIQDPVYEVKYSETTREITINNVLISKPDFYKENEIVFGFIYKHPKQRISTKTIKDHVKTELGKPMTKTLHKIIENLGFTGDIKQVFFDTSSEGIFFRNPITKSELNDLGIKYLHFK